MSSKWRAIQHRHRYTYNSVVFPKQFVEALDAMTLEAFAAWDFFPQLKRFVDLSSTYAQVAAVKELASAFGRLVASASEPPDGNASVAVRLYLEILFLENSLPLHRILISALAKSRRFLPLIGSCFVSLCEEYGGGSNSAKKGKKAFLVSRAALSVISYPKMDYLKETLEICADLAAMDVVAGLGTVVSDLNDGLRPSPVIMEQCQEALSCLYYLLQRYPATFGSSEAEEGNSSTFRSIIRTVLSVLKSPAFSRDCLVAAGVSFCSALQICMAPSELSSFISRGLFGFSSYDSDTDDLDAKKILSDCEIYATIQELSTLSRLCLLRGILTAIPRNVLNMCLTQTSNESFWTILYDGILPDLCKYCENPVDSHFNFHALTVTQICLQQIKTSIVAGVTDFSADYHPFTEGTMGRILKIIWNNLEDPLSQTVKQVHLIFDLLLDIEFSLPSVEGYDRGKQFLHKIAKDLLCLGYRCKGRYVPLAFITKRLGAKTMLSFNAKLLYETAYAYIDDDVCCAVTSFLKCFFECLRDECWSSDGVEKGYDNFRDLCLPPLLQGLVSGHSKLRSNLNTYALPLILEIDTDSIFPMLAYIYIGPNIGESVPADLKIEHCVAALVSLIKVSRILALIEGDIDFESDTLPQKKSPDSFAFVRIKGINVRVPVEWIVLALKHADDSLRIDAAESLFLNPKTSSLPSSLELSLMKVAVPLNMRCTSTAFQMKWTSLFRKFFSRVRTALERQVKQHSWNPDACLNGTEDSILDHSRDLTFYRTKELFQFMKWLSCYLFNSCYPSAPYERKTMAMELILVMIEVWPIILPQGNHYIYPYTEETTSPDSTLALVGSIIDSWDRLRENSFRILLSFPTPLPGISTGGSLNALIRWAKKLVCSPRVRESDAGALTLRLIFKKYVVGLGWVFDSSANGGCCSSQNKQINGNLGIHEFRVPTVDYISSLIEWLSIVVEEGERDLSQACSKSFVHGVLLTLRYTFEELDWSSYVVQSSILEMRRLIEKLLGLIMRITSLALWVVSADIWSMPYDMEDAVDDSTFLTDTPVEQNIPDLDQGDRIMTSDDSLKPAEHVVMVGCWLAMKEVSLLLATVIQKIPLPSCTFPDLSKHGDSDRDNDGIEISTMSESVLDLVQLENIGNHFLQVLLKMKHNGAIDKTRAGFTALCNRLLCSNDPRLCKMTDSWMEQLMERTTAKGQTVDDLLRRSAGIPAAFLALFLSEPEGTPKKLLPKTLRWLIDVASSSLSNNNKDSDISNEAVYEEVLTNSEMLVALHKKGQNSKIRDEGVVPTVHAFNVLRVAFDDTNLATDTSGFCAEAMIISIRSFSSSYWEVRNSACLAYTALVRRMIGFLNTQRRESVRRALTGLEFFHRYPALHPFLFSELKIATELFGDGCSRHMETNMEKVIHPSLCPILILLTRLKPSLVSHRADDSLDPFLLTPFIRKCATQSNLRLRVLASRALTGLVSNEKLQNVIREAAHGLPCQRNHITDQICDRFTRTANPVSFNYIHGVLLQLASLLDNNCRQLPDILKKDQILGELIHVLLSRSWIGSSRSCTCPTLNSSYLRVLDLMLDISRTYTMSKHTETIQGLLLGLASECLGADKSNGLIFHDPTTVELHKQAVISYFNCLLEGDPEGSQEGIQLLKLTSPISKLSKLPKNKVSLSQLEETILSCIHDPTYEVRIATLKKLLQLVRSMIPGECGSVMCLWAKSHLHRLLIKLLSKEENPKCMYYILKIIFNWDLMQLETPSDSFSDFLYPFWDRLVDLTSSVKHAKTKEISLCCMGVCVKKFVEFHMSYVLAACQIDEESAKSSNSAYLTKSWSKAFKSIDHFINLIKCHSAPSEPVSIRRAAAQAIIASGLLKEVLSVAPFVSKGFQTVEEHDINIEEIITRSALTEVINVYACRILDLWFTCIQLLEDEDVVLREKLAKDVQNCISSRRPNSSFTDATPTQVDRMIQSSFDFLSSTFGNWVGYLNYLSKCVILTASSTSTYGDLVRQIFDKEIDNHHEEKLLICQICCLHLKELTDSNYWAAGVDNQTFGESNIQTFSWSCRMKFLYQLTSFTSSLLEIDGKADWIGGIGNHKDAFVPVYANLLGLYALSHGASPDGSKDKDKYLCEFMELGGVIRPFLRNPLISNLYHQVLQLHQSILSSQAHKSQVLDCPSRDTRDPFFLLR